MIVVAAVARGVVAGKGGGVVVQHRGRGAAVAFDGGGIHGQGFDGRAWLALQLRGAVQPALHGVFAPAHNAQHRAAFVIDAGHGALRLFTIRGRIRKGLARGILRVGNLLILLIQHGVDAVAAAQQCVARYAQYAAGFVQHRVQIPAVAGFGGLLRDDGNCLCRSQGIFLLGKQVIIPHGGQNIIAALGIAFRVLLG